MKSILPSFTFSESYSTSHFTLVVDPIRHFGWITQVSVEILSSYENPSVETGKNTIEIRLSHDNDFLYWDLVTDFIYCRCSERRPADASVDVARGILRACDEYMIRHVHSR